MKKNERKKKKNQRGIKQGVHSINTTSVLLLAYLAAAIPILTVLTSSLVLSFQASVDRDKR